MGTANKVTSFRKWVQDLWYDNCAEHESFGENPYTMKQYWDKYKYWLKREFKHQQGNSHE